MNTHTRSRFLAWLLLVAMVLTMLPTAAFAAEAATYTKITTMEELTSGQYVMVVNTGYGPGVYENGWITAQAIDAGSDTVTGSVLPWTITVDGDTVKLTDSNGVAAAPKGGNNNGIVAGDYSWLVTCTDGTFQFAGQGVDTVLLASNKGAENKFRAYKSATVSGNPAGYPSEFTLYKLPRIQWTPPIPRSRRSRCCLQGTMWSFITRPMGRPCPPAILVSTTRAPM